MLTKLARLVIAPALLMNVFAGVVGFVWMLFSAEWRGLIMGVLYAFISPIVLGFALLPAMVFAVPLVLLAQKTLLRGVVPSLVGFLLCFLAQLYTVALFTAAIVTVLVEMPSYMTSVSRIGVLLWAYGVALWPWQYMERQENANKEAGDGHAETFHVIMASIGTTAAVVVSCFSPLSAWGYSYIIGGTMLFGALLSSVLGFAALRGGAVLD